MDRLKTNIVPPDGPLDAKICFIGQSPGREEDEANPPIPFIGAAGQLFNRCLQGRGIMLKRSEVLVNNVFAQRPPKNNVKYFFESYLNTLTWEGEEHVARLQRWLEGLLELREQGKGGPNVLVALGTEAMWVLTGKKRITKWRGSVLPCTLVPGFKVYITFHPSYVNRLMNEPEERLQGQKKVQKQNALPLFLWDLRRIKIQAETELPMRMKRKFIINPNLEESLHLLRYKLDSSQVSCDIETIKTNSGLILWCVGFSPRPEFAFSIPLLRRGKLVWSPQEEALIWREVSKLFLNSNILKIFHNGGFDLSALGRYYGLRVVKGTLGDTMWCFQATYPMLLKGLDTLTSVYTWEPYYKDDGKWWDGRRISDEAEYTYNCKDCAVEREIWPQVERDAKVHGTWGNYQTHMRVMPSSIAKMIKGVKLDERTKGDLGGTFRSRAEEEQAKVRALTGDEEFNTGSSAQVQRLLYGYMGLPVQYNHKTKKPSADKDAINRLRKKVKTGSETARILSAISDYRKFDKLVTTYADMKIEPDGRVRTSYGWISTFRLNSSESLFGGGGNLQNIPIQTEEGKEIRRLFVPDPGYLMLSVDGSQAEAREVAWDSYDLELIEAFSSGEIDVHWMRAKPIFLIPEHLEYHKEDMFTSPVLREEFDLWHLRDIGKKVVHATNYGMGPRMLQSILIRIGVYLEYRVCQELLARAHRARPAIRQWQTRIREEVRTTRTLTNSFGDKREFRGRLNDNLFRAAYAYKPQSNVGRITQLADQEIHEKVDIYEPLLNVHDEIVGQCLPEHLQRSMEEIQPIFEIPHETGGQELIIPCEFKVGPNWGDLEEVKR